MKSNTNAPSMGEGTVRGDLVRQVVLTVSAVFMIVGTLYGIGLLGTRVEEAAGGSLSATATLVAPAVPAFSIWSVIYGGLIGYVVWQWLPGNAANERARAIGWLAAATMVLNATWLLVTQVGWLWVSVAVIVTLVAALGILMQRLTQLTGGVRSRSWGERILVDGTFGLYLGWTSVATVANITATLVDAGVDPGGRTAEILAVVVLAAAAGIGVLLAALLGGRIAVAAALAWGLAWIAVGRIATEPSSAVTAVASALAALVVVTAALVNRLTRRTGRPALVRVAR